MADTIHILHIDNKQDFAETTAKHLEQEEERFAVETATGAAEGLEKLTADTDCIISDYEMPGRNGIDLLSSVRERFPDLPYILYTGKGSEAVASDAISAGVTDYLQKQPGPEQYKLLAARIKTAVGQYRAEQELERQNELFAKTQDLADVGAWEYNPQEEETYFSEKVYEIYGVSPDYDPSPEADLSKFYHPEDQDVTREAVEKALEQGKPYDLEVRITAADGTDKWIRTRADPTFENGSCIQVRGTIRDITERKQYEQELEKIQDFFNQAERLGKLGAWEFDADGNVEWTEGTRRIHEVDDEFEPTVEDGVSFFHPDDRERVRAAIDGALETGESYDVEARLITAEGNQRWVRTRGNPIPDSETVVRGYIQDITEPKERQQELRKLNNQLEAAVKAGRVGTWLWQVPEDKLVMRPEFAGKFGVDPEDASEGASLDQFLSSIHEADRERVANNIETAIQTCGEYEEEYRVWNADNELRWVVARGVVECDENGEPDRFPGVLIDVTKRKQYETQLERQNERLDKFANVLGHDLRNPLNVAQARLDLADEECNSDHLDDAITAVDRSIALIEDLQTLTHEGGRASDIETVDLETVASRCWKTVETANANLLTETERRIRADSNQLKQLLENLFGNAVEHGGDTVTITVGDLADGFYVADDGPGIPDSEREQVFEVGYSTAAEGTGFGLNIVAEIVEAHDWEITASESEDGGARFEITGVEFVYE